MRHRIYKTGYFLRTFDHQTENGEWIEATQRWFRTYNGAWTARAKAGESGIILRIINEDCTERVR